MEFGLFQQQTTNLVMTKELRQAINLLQYSAADLSAYIYEQSLENPLIEIEESSSAELDAGRIERQLLKSSFQPVRNVEKNASPIDYALVEQTSIHDFLLKQLGELSLLSKQEEQLRYFIYSLRDDGYLSRPLSELCSSIGVTEEEGEALLQELQSLDPAGIGARSLQECLLLQLRRLPERERLAEQIVEHYMDWLAEKKWKALSLELSVTFADIQAVYDRIQKLDPRPGTQYSSEPTNYLIPDLSMVWKEGELVVLLHDDYLPTIHLNRQYERMLLEQQNTEATQYAKQKYQQVQWLLRSIQQRQQTIKKVADAILHYQYDFFAKKDGVLKPLTLRNVAEEIGMHESTVSRVTTNKYAQTPRGLFELKLFFSSAIQNEEGESTSSQSIKIYLKEIVSTENKKKPLSDQKIVELLKKEKEIAVSRRAIAKYRDELGIPSSAKRKRYE